MPRLPRVQRRGLRATVVAEEITGEKIEPKWLFVAGMIADGELVVTRATGRKKPIVLQRGLASDIEVSQAISELSPGDVFIKGANALDMEGNVGVLVGNIRGGTIGEAQSVVQTRDVLLLAPVGYEKLVPSVPEASRQCGIYRFKYSTGVPVGMIPMPTALAFTEVQAMQTLFRVQAVVVAAGGNAGSEGSVVLSVSGDAAQIEAMMGIIKSIKGEPPIARPERENAPAAEFGYDAAKQRGK